MLFIRQISLFAISLITLATSGCTLHMPASELLMFGDAKPVPPRRTVDAMAISYTALPLGPAPYLREADRRYKRTSSFSVGMWNAQRQGVMASPVWFLSDRTSAFSFSLGSAAGLDVTTRLGPRSYLTVAGSLAGAEIISQWSPPETRGVALGVAMRYERYFVSAHNSADPPENILLLSTPNEWFSVASLGVRMTGVLTEWSRTSAYVRMIIYWGYAPAMRHTEFRMGVSVGAF